MSDSARWQALKEQDLDAVAGGGGADDWHACQGCARVQFTDAGPMCREFGTQVWNVPTCGRRS